jgi:hypothetical protein
MPPQHSKTPINHKANPIQSPTPQHHPHALNSPTQIAYGLSYLLLPGMPNLQYGLFCVGSAPGGGASNQWTIMLDGNIDLSITMTAVSSIAALGL